MEVATPMQTPMEVTTFSDNMFVTPLMLKKTSVNKQQHSMSKLPKDPRLWTREHVHNWLQQMSKTHNLHEIKPSRFVMNGKALCLMTAAMFSNRVPVGGKLLYKDFQLRLASAIHCNQR